MQSVEVHPMQKCFMSLSSLVFLPSHPDGKWAWGSCQILHHQDGKASLQSSPRRNSKNGRYLCTLSQSHLPKINDNNAFSHFNLHMSTFLLKDFKRVSLPFCIPTVQDPLVQIPNGEKLWLEELGERPMRFSLTRAASHLTRPQGWRPGGCEADLVARSYCHAHSLIFFGK